MPSSAMDFSGSDGDEKQSSDTPSRNSDRAPRLPRAPGPATPRTPRSRNSRVRRDSADRFVVRRNNNLPSRRDRDERSVRPQRSDRSVQRTNVGRGARQCFCCGLRGHSSHQCYQRHKSCDICGRVGHLAKVCRNRDSRRSRDRAPKGSFVRDGHERELSKSASSTSSTSELPRLTDLLVAAFTRQMANESNQCKYVSLFLVLVVLNPFNNSVFAPISRIVRWFGFDAP
eukprot:950610_1